MDLFVSDDNDPDYYVEYESGDDARDWRYAHRNIHDNIEDPSI